MTGEGMSPRPWHVTNSEADGIVDAEHFEVLCANRYDDGVCSVPENAAGIVWAVNLLFPPPEAVQTPETLLALAVLRGDPSAAYALADELAAKCAAPAGFVSREELIGFFRDAGRQLSLWDHTTLRCFSCDIPLLPDGKVSGNHKSQCISHRYRDIFERLGG